MIDIHSNATIYTVVPCEKSGPVTGETDAEYRGGEYISDDLTQAAIVCEALNLRHRHEGKKEAFCIETSDAAENLRTALANVKIDRKRVFDYLVTEMGVEEELAERWIKADILSANPANFSAPACDFPHAVEERYFPGKK